MYNKFRSLIPNNLVNYSKHLPTAVAANLKYGFPSKGMQVVGVTGTDGKTTTVNMIYQILKAAGKSVSVISTVNAVINNQEYDTGFHWTSPEAMDLQKYIKLAREAGTEVLVLEVSSFALAQFRVWGIKFDVGVVTNITRDHFDYHHDFEDYFKTKAKLLKGPKFAVINRDEAHYERLAKLATGQVISFGFSPKATINPADTNFKLKVPGDFNILNGLAAYAVATSLKIDPAIINRTLNEFRPVKGRMNEIENKRQLRIFVDYAHTPNGLEQALKTLRGLGKGKLIAIIGAEGYRDEGKRFLMGEVASKLADIIIVTSVDPRGSADKINAQIVEGIKKHNSQLDGRVYVEVDRAKAIKLAIKLAKRGDMVGVFGKGHETSQNMDGKHELPWSDFEAVEKALDES